METCKKCNKKSDYDKFLLCSNCSGFDLGWKLEDNYKDASGMFPKLLPKIDKIMQYIKKEKIPFDDQRNQTIVALNDLIGWAIYIQISFGRDFAKQSSIGTKWIIAQNKKIQQAQLSEIITNFGIVNRSSVLSNFMFTTEVFLKKVNEALSNKYSANSYKELVKHVIKQLKIKNTKNEKYDILYLPALVRNTLHYNGMHTENNTNGKIDGYLFKFVKNESVAFVSWRHIFFFCDHILDVLDEIMTLKMLKGVYLKPVGKPKRTY